MADFQVAVQVFGLQERYGGDPQAFIDVAVMADELGIDQMVFTDHVIMGERTDRYPFGSFPVAPEYPWYEPLTLMAAIASRTQRLRLATGVLIAPLRPAALLAKTIATLDVLSGGRVDLGIGVGWQREEYEAEGLDFDARWGMVDDHVRLLRSLWENVPASFSGGDIAFERLYSVPQPAQRRLPVWFGVRASDRNARRIAELGDGWLPIIRDPAEIGGGVARIREAMIEHGRDPARLAVRAQLPVATDSGGRPSIAATLENLDETLAAGVTHIEFMTAVFAPAAADIEPFLRAVAAAKQ